MAPLAMLAISLRCMVVNGAEPVSRSTIARFPFRKDLDANAGGLGWRGDMAVARGVKEVDEKTHNHLDPEPYPRVSGKASRQKKRRGGTGQREHLRTCQFTPLYNRTAEVMEDTSLARLVRLEVRRPLGSRSI